MTEAATLLREAAAAGRRVSIGRAGGDVLVSTERLDQVLEHEAGDLTATVEAGVRVRDLNARLAAHGQRLSLDPPGNPTIGACVAASLSGPLRHRYGSPRDLVIGMTVVLGDGTIASSGGKVVKNVAGYDLGKLFCGSAGRLGLIVRVALRLHPLPAAAATLVAPVAGAEGAAAAVSSLLRSSLTPASLDVLWPGRLLARFEGSERAVAWQLETAAGLLGGEAAAESVWDEAADRQLASDGRLPFATSRLRELLESEPEALIRPGPGVAYLPHAVPDPRDPAAVALAERVRTAFDPQGVLA